MNIEKFIDAFVATIIVAMGVVILAQLWYPNVGEVLIDILPSVVEVLVNIFIVVFVALLIYQLIEQV